MVDKYMYTHVHVPVACMYNIVDLFYTLNTHVRAEGCALQCFSVHGSVVFYSALRFVVLFIMCVYHSL